MIDIRQVKNRVVEKRRIRSEELLGNSANWRTHPDDQANALTGLLTQIGQVQGLVAYYSERNGGKLTLIDGHLRRDLDPDLEWDVSITDLNDAEADLIMTVLDPLSAMAGVDAKKLDELTGRVNSDDIFVRDLLLEMEREAKRVAEQAEQEDAERKRDEGGPPMMELLPFEHYDYVLIAFRNELDWTAALDFFQLERRDDPLSRRSKRVGLARVVDGAKFLEKLAALRGK